MSRVSVSSRVEEEAVVGAARVGDEPAFSALVERFPAFGLPPTIE